MSPMNKHVPIYPSIYLPASHHLSIPSSFPLIHVPISFFFLPIHQSTHLSIDIYSPSTHPSIHAPSIYSSIHLSINPHIPLSHSSMYHSSPSSSLLFTHHAHNRLLIHPPTCLPTYPFHYLPFHSSSHPSTYPAIQHYSVMWWTLC